MSLQSNICWTLSIRVASLWPCNSRSMLEAIWAFKVTCCWDEIFLGGSSSPYKWTSPASLSAISMFLRAGRQLIVAGLFTVLYTFLLAFEPSRTSLAIYLPLVVMLLRSCHRFSSLVPSWIILVCSSLLVSSVVASRTTIYRWSSSTKQARYAASVRWTRQQFSLLRTEPRFRTSFQCSNMLCHLQVRRGFCLFNSMLHCCRTAILNLQLEIRTVLFDAAMIYVPVYSSKLALDQQHHVLDVGLTYHSRGSSRMTMGPCTTCWGCIWWASVRAMA